MIRKARPSDVKGIQRLINFYAEKGLMLPRSLNELYENLRDFWVYTEKRKILGCCALHLSWKDLAEIKSLVVEESFQNKGIGSALIEVSLKEAKEFAVKEVFVLSYSPDYFKKFGFKKISKERLPHRIWQECIRCSKFPDCKEIALIKQL